jgi:hypothetical protein
MPCGDYSIVGWDSCCVVERKAGARELTSNFSRTDYSRFMRALRRLAKDCHQPQLVIEMSPANLEAEAARLDWPCVGDYIANACASLGVSLHYLCTTPRNRIVAAGRLLRDMLTLNIHHCPKGTQDA